MQYHWLNKRNNENLIIFFGGWSFDYKPFEFLSCETQDVIMFYDYSDINMPEIDFNSYNNIALISWSMGVFIAYLLKDKLPDLTQKIAVNGTPYPVHNDFGIPEKPFLLTLRHAKTGLEGKFYQNIFNKEEELNRYMLSPIERSIDNRVDELKNIYDLIKKTETNYDNFYNNAIISINDKIIPCKNQQNFWNSPNINVYTKTIESGHFPYYNFKSWNEILLCK